MIVKKDGSISEISESFFVARDFVSSDEAKLLIDFIESYQHIAFVGQEGRRRSIPIGVVPFEATSQHIEKMNKIKLFNFPTEVQQTFRSIVDRIIDLARELYGDQDEMHCSNAIFAKHLSGGKVPVHIDAEPGGDEHLYYSSIVYLNTILDGTINFPHLDVSYRPNSGDLLIFRSNHKNSEHEVTSVSDTRYSIPIFISKDKNCYVE